MNLPPTGSSTRLSKLESRELRQGGVSAAAGGWRVIVRFTLMRRDEMRINVHATHVVPSTHGRARSQPYIIEKNEFPNMNLLSALSDTFHFPMPVPPISSHIGLLI